ncbi:MAG TPA: mycothiol system anti-sigma-R factor [Acidimicrobiales bacterium]|nr:mycothiol system anti-sigma-R factor [Acidimicrobiales bacterium]
MAHDCSEALNQLFEFIDGELTEQRRAVIHTHLEECSPCLEAFEFEAELRTVVARRCHDEVPDQLKARIAASLQALDAEPPASGASSA